MDEIATRLAAGRQPRRLPRPRPRRPARRAARRVRRCPTASSTSTATRSARCRAATAARLAEVAEREWGEGLIRSWNNAGWIDLLAAASATRSRALIGARAGEVSVADSTSLNLFKALSAAVALQRADAPARRVILSERGNFPTDLYIAESVAASHGLVLRLADGARIDDALTTTSRC